MNFDEALEMLGPLRNPNMDSWRGRHEEPYEHQQFSAQRFSSGPSGQMNFPTVRSNLFLHFFSSLLNTKWLKHTDPIAEAHEWQTRVMIVQSLNSRYKTEEGFQCRFKRGNWVCLQANSAPNLLNNMNNASSGANNSIISNMSPALVQKMLSQGAGGLQGFGGSSSASGRTIQAQSQPSSAQLRMLVQQIQMAVQAGYLNHQVRTQKKLNISVMFAIIYNLSIVCKNKDFFFSIHFNYNLFLL